MSAQSLETKLTQAWQRQANWLWLLLPLSWLYGLVSSVRRAGYRLGVLKQYKAPVPVLVIGNISIGGSGKTPLIIALVQHLQQKGVKVGVISRGYGGDERVMPALVEINSKPDIVGDEPCLIVAQTQVAMAVCPNRRQAIELLLSHHNDIELIIADDGLQHYALARDIEWIVVDASRGFGNRQLLPTGFLREPMSRLKGATGVWHYADNKMANRAALSHGVTSEDSDGRQLTMYLQSKSLTPVMSANDYLAVVKQLQQVLKDNKLRCIELLGQLNYDELIARLNVTELQHDQYNQHIAPQVALSQATSSHVTAIQQDCDNVQFNNEALNKETNKETINKVQAISGIGYPTRFFNSLRQLGFEVIEHPYPDHYDFQWSDLIQHLHDDPHPIIMTSKDAVKIVPILRDKLIQTAECFINELMDVDIKTDRLNEIDTKKLRGNERQDSQPHAIQEAFNQLSLALDLLSRLWVLPVSAELSAECFTTLHRQLHTQGISI